MEEKETKDLEQEVAKEENTEEVKAEETTEEVKEAPVEEAKPEYNGPVVKTKVRYDYRTMKYYNMYAMIYRRHFKVTYLVMGIIGILFGLGYGGYSYYQQVMVNKEAFSYTLLIFPIVFVLFGVYFIYEAINFEKVIDKNIATHFYKNPKVVNLDVTVTEEKITLRTSTQTGEPFDYDWAYVTEIVEIPQYYFLFVGKQPVIIEKDPNKVVEGEYEDLVKMIMDKTSSKPYKKVDKELVTKPITFVHQEDAEAMEQAEQAEVAEDIPTVDVTPEEDENNTDSIDNGNEQ